MADRKRKPAASIKPITKKEKVELKKKEQEKAAEVFEEFVASFETSEKSKVKTFVRGGIVNATKEEEEAEIKKSKLYRPSTKFVPVSQHGSPTSSSESKKAAFKKKADEKKKSNLELFKEELKLGPVTTNLYINCISPKMNEELLCREFCKYGPLASVKIMWPRTDEERCRTSNRAFVAFMTRKDAERAMAALDGKVIMGFEMKLGWGKPARIPPQPLYTPAGVRMAPPPPSGLPFNAQPRDRFRNDFTKPLGSSKAELDKTLSEAVVKVVIPTERNLLFLIHRMIEFVVREGPLFEAMIMNKEKNNPDYRFLFDNKSQDHVYYRWKLFSILQGESPTKWRTAEFRLFRGGSLWRPPILNSYTERCDEGAGVEEAAPPVEEEVKKGQLRSEHRQRLEALLEELSPSREEIARAMLFCLDRADAAEEVVGHISDSFCPLQVPLQKKLARIYLVSDILHNSCAKVAGASYYRKYFEAKLPQIFDHLHAAQRNIQARLQAEQFKQKVMGCFRAWEDWAIYPQPYLIQLQNIFLGFAKAGEEDAEMAEVSLSARLQTPPLLCIDGAPLDSTLIDGLPMGKAAVDDIDGCPLGWDPLNGVPVDDIDGMPLSTAIDDIDGVPCESTVSKTLRRLLFSANSCNLQDEDSDSDSSADSCRSPNYEGPVFSQMSESKRKRLREVEVKVMKLQDELESGKTKRKSGMSIQQQVESYRKKLLQKTDRGTTGDTETRAKRTRTETEGRAVIPERSHEVQGASLLQGKWQKKKKKKKKSPKRSKRSRSPSPVQKAGKSKSRSPHRSHKKAKKSKH
uniref:Zgc:163098 n=1 Tax=Fundulus heteroclitus TaxID=8078 RepID=A0A3Q2QPU0_FUNHE